MANTRDVVWSTKPDNDVTPLCERKQMHKPNNLLESDVQEELDWDARFDDSRVIIKANDGEVTLTGAVDTFYDTLLATDDTWTVGGVKSVSNELLVGLVGEGIADADLAAGCLDALDRDRLVPKGTVNVVAVDGWVTLSGEVRRHYQRQAAYFAVSRVNGVVGISNDITLTKDAMPGDVVDRINKAFKRDAIIDDSLIQVTTSGNTVYLDGSVESWSAMDDAVETAWGAPGVTDVENRLIIVP
jgi:osmotically-inducible protein OsmY